MKCVQYFSETIWQHYVENDGKYLLCDLSWFLNYRNWLYT